MSETSSTSIGQIGTRIFTVGTSSGINTTALIDAAYKQRTFAADQIDIKIDKNNSIVSGYQELTTLSNSVKSSLASLRKSYGVLNANSNAFAVKTGAISASDGSNPAGLMNVAIANGTANGSYELEIIQRAQAMKVGGGVEGSSTAPLGYSGDFTLELAGGTSANISVTAGMSLSDIASAINAQKATSGVSASVIKINDTQYQMVLTGTQTNKNIIATPVSGGALASLNFDFGTPIQVAQPALLELDGVPVQRDNNTITDLIAGVTLDVKNQAPGVILSLEIGNDTSTVKDALENFINSYNELRDFITANQQIDEDAEATSPLFGDNIMAELSRQLSSVFGINFTTPSSISTIRDIGLALDGSNRLIISDDAKLEDALNTNYESVKALFETQVTSSNAEFRMIANKSLAQSMSLTIDIVMTGPAITGVTVNGDSTAFDIDGATLIGKAGTIYEGLSFGYIGTTNATITLDFNQGTADLMSNTIDLFTDSVNGSITTKVQQITDQNTDLSAEAVDIRAKADEFKLRLVDRYAAFEARISAAKSVLAQMKAILGIKDDE